MKNRILLLLMVLIMLVNLAACSGKSSVPEETVSSEQTIEMVEIEKEVPTVAVTEAKENPNIISFDEPLVILDNEFFRMELLRFRTATEGSHAIGPRTWKWSEGVVYLADFQFYNKSAYPYKVLQDVYLVDEEVQTIIQIGNGNIESPAPGKNALMEMTIAHWDGIQELPIELDELYQLNGTFEIHGDDVPRTTFSFSVADTIAMAG